MIGDSANEASEKDSFESEKEKLETLNDEKKGSLLFVQMTLMHHILNHLRVNCNSLDFHFVDDKEAILFAVYSSFTDYPEKFPMQGSKLYLYYKSIAYAEEVNDPPELYDGANKKYPIVFPNKACVKDPMVQIAKFVCKGLPVINSCEDIIKIINSIGTFSKKRIVYLDSDDWKCFEVDETLPSFLDIEAFCRNFKLELPLLSRVSSPLPLSQSVASRGFQPIQANISAPQTFKILFEKVIDILDIKNGGEFKSVKSKCSIQFQFNNISQKYTIGSGAIYNDPATRSGNMCLIDSLLQLVDFKGDRKKECLRIKTALFNDKKVSNLVDFINSEDANTILNIHDSKFKYYTVLVHAVYFDEMNPRPYYRVVSTSNLYENMSSDLVEDDSKKIIHIYFNGSDHFEPILPNQAFHSHKAAPMTTCEEFSF
jgi:hypothetical protein